jgi:hypothetical protein
MSAQLMEVEELLSFKAWTGSRMLDSAKCSLCSPLAIPGSDQGFGQAWSLIGR